MSCKVYWKGRFIPHTNEEVITSMDIFATSVWMGGGQIPADRAIDGKNMASYLNYENVDPKEETPFFYFGVDHKLMAVRKGPWKLHIQTYSQTGIDYFSGKLPLLFNLNEDPSEKYDLADKNPDIVKGLIILIDYKLKEIKETGSFFDYRQMSKYNLCMAAKGFLYPFAVVYFVFHSACTIFIQNMKIGGASEIKINKLILYSTQLALSLFRTILMRDIR